MANSKRTQATVTALVNAAIKSDLNNEKAVKEALAEAILLAADNDIGRFEPLNLLFRGVSNGTADNIRLYMVNLVDKTGIEVTNEAGRTRKIGFFTYSRTNGFAHVAEKTDATKEHRAIVAAMSVEQLMEIPLGRANRESIERSMEVSLEAFETKIAAAINWGIKNKVLTPAKVEQYNKLLDETKRVDPRAIEKAEQERFERMAEQASKRGFKLVPVNEETKAGKVETVQSNAKAA